MGSSLARQLSVGAVSNFLLKILALALSFLLSVVLARLLGATGFGEYSYIVAIVGLLSIPATLGLQTLLVRLVAGFAETGKLALMKGAVRASLGAVAIISVALALAAAVFFERLPGLSGGALRSELLFIGLLMLPLMAVTSVGLAVLRGLRHVVISQVPESVLKPLVLLVLVAMLYQAGSGDLGVAGVLWAGVLSCAATLCVTLMIVYLRKPSEFRVTAAEYRLREWLTSALPLLLSGGMFFINSKMDVLMLGYLRDANEVGVYQVASRGGSLMMISLAVIASVIAPSIVELHSKGELGKLQKLLSMSSMAAFLVTLPLAICLVFFGEPVLSLVFGAEYLAAALPLAILSMAHLFSSAMGSSALLLNMTAHEKLTFLGVSFAALVNIILNYLLIPVYAAEGAAIATAVSISLWNILLVIMCMRTLGLNPGMFGFRVGYLSGPGREL